MTSLVAVATGVLSPRHRRWRRLLRTLTLDPDQLPRPLTPPPAQDFFICGSPRSGTALATAMLFQPPSVVTVMEPWDALRLPPAELFGSIRSEILSTGELRRGRLDVAALEERGEVRWCRDGERPVAVEVSPDFRLGVKLPAFWRYLDLLPTSKFVVCLRHPVDVVASYERTGGRLLRGLEYDVPFNARMNEQLVGATRDEALRRVLMYEHISRALLPHLGRPNVFVLRYERWHSEPTAVLRELSAFLGTEVTSPLATVRPPPITVRNRQVPELIRTHCTSAAELGYDLTSRAPSET